MSTLTLRNSLGQAVEVESFTATDAKNSFGAVLEKALRSGIVAITKRDKPRAVVLSLDEYEALMARVPDELASLRNEFDTMINRMQTARAKGAGRALFAATPTALGRKVTGTRKRG